MCGCNNTKKSNNINDIIKKNKIIIKKIWEKSQIQENAIIVKKINKT